MKTILSALILFCSSVPLSAEPGILSLIFSHQDFDVIMDGDVSPAGRNLRRPTPENPVYYIAVAAGYRDFGKAIAGEKPPKQKAMVDVITKVLDKQGYKLASNKNAPEMIIIYSWGTMNASPWQLPWSVSPSESGFTGSSTVVANAYQVLGFLGYNKDPSLTHTERVFPQLASGLSIVRDHVDMLRELSAMDYHAIALAAYDLDAAKHTDGKLLWRTHISSPSLGFDMFDALPKMAAIAGPQIGRQIDTPIRIRASDHYRPDVEIGEATVVPDKSDAGR